MDDCIRSVNTVEMDLHAVNGTGEVRAKEVKNLDDQCSSQVLDVRWNVSGCELYFCISVPDLSSETTNRTMLKVFADMYDTIGLGCV